MKVQVLILLAAAALLAFARAAPTWETMYVDSLSNSSVRAFAQNYTDIARYLNQVDPGISKYVLVNEGDIMVDNVSNDAQTIKYLTKSHSNACSEQKYIYYLRTDQLSLHKFPAHYIIIPLRQDSNLEKELINNYKLNAIPNGTFNIFSK